MTASEPALLSLLEEVGLPADEELTTLLAGLHELGTGQVPEPAPAVAALLAGRGVRRGRHRRRGAVIGALVLVSLGTGVTAAAADPGVRIVTAGAVAAVVHVVHPEGVHPTAAGSRPAVPARPAAQAGGHAAAPTAAQRPTAARTVSAAPVAIDDGSAKSLLRRSGSGRVNDGAGSGIARHHPDSGGPGDSRDGSVGSGSGATGNPASGSSGSSGEGSGSGHDGSGSGSDGSGDRGHRSGSGQGDDGGDRSGSGGSGQSSGDDSGDGSGD